MNISLSSLLIVIAVFAILGASHGGPLRQDYYRDSCPYVEDIVREVTWKHVAQDLTVAAPLLRLHFHDCFVRYNESLWEVPLGRRDGTISLASEAIANIPPPTLNFDQLKQNFTCKGLDVHDLVVLSGYGQDPSLNSSYATYLKTKCKNLSDSTTTVAMDPGSSLSFDTHYYKILLEYEGLFQSDAALLTDKRSFEEVKKLLSIKYFLEKFAYSMKKMGEIQVLTGTEGQIRKKCSVVN
uniref:peroxidase n=1 Tax=Fagus sylvatica TaxID=28930 RepID=A0A2N9EU85_FAGSY